MEPFDLLQAFLLASRLASLCARAALARSADGWTLQIRLPRCLLTIRLDRR
jgi:hypothetical protein